MADNELTMLRKEVAHLRAELKDVSDALKLECDSTTKHINKIYRHISTINDYLKPLVGKVFPGYAETTKQIDDLVKGSGATRNNRKKP